MIRDQGSGINNAALVYIAIGSNVGDRHKHVESARAAIAGLTDTFIVAASSVEETAPLGGRQQEMYLNQMLAVTTGLDPEQLLDELQRIETEHGRTRRERWDSRTLDLDIVSFGDLALASARLTVPHPGLAEREFWQREIAQIEEAL